MLTKDNDNAPFLRVLLDAVKKGVLLEPNGEGIFIFPNGLVYDFPNNKWMVGHEQVSRKPSRIEQEIISTEITNMCNAKNLSANLLVDEFDKRGINNFLSVVTIIDISPEGNKFDSDWNHDTIRKVLINLGMPKQRIEELFFGELSGIPTLNDVEHTLLILTKIFGEKVVSKLIDISNSPYRKYHIKAKTI